MSKISARNASSAGGHDEVRRAQQSAVANLRRVCRFAPRTLRLEGNRRRARGVAENFRAVPRFAARLLALEDYFEKLSLSRRDFPDARVERGALLQIMAIRIWQLKHDGRFPESLSALVPSELAELPTDPYSGRPFGYRPWHGEPIGRTGNWLSHIQSNTKPPPGSRMLYSVGLNRQDDNANAGQDPDLKFGPRRLERSDIVFVIPPLPGKPGAIHNVKNKAVRKTDPTAAGSPMSPVLPGTIAEFTIQHT